MSSRDYIRHVVSANTSINGQRLGDEVYDPTTNKLYKTVPIGGIQVTNVEVLLNNSQIVTNNISSIGSISSAGSVSANSYSILGSPYINNNRTISYYGTTHNVLGSGSGTRTIDLSLGNYVSATATGITTWVFSNPIASPASIGFVLELTNGGSATQNWPAGSVKWPGGTAPTLTAAGVDVLTFITDDGGTTWRGVASMLDSK
jgi:hypothetical protein